MSDDGNGFLATLPEEIRAEPSLATIKDLPALAKGYVSAQKLIGAKRIALPGDNASDQQLAEFYAAIGRPETHDKYETPQFKFSDESLQVKPEVLDGTKQVFHKLGLTNKQARGVLEHYMKFVDDGAKAQSSNRVANESQAISKLKDEWGDKFDANIDVAKSIIRKFGQDMPELGEFLNETGLGSNVPLVKFFHKIGHAIMEDHAINPGGGNELPVGDRARSTQEIDSLKIDKQFQSALTNPRDPGHKAAVERWTALHKVAYPGVVAS